MSVRTEALFYRSLGRQAQDGPNSTEQLKGPSRARCSVLHERPIGHAGFHWWGLVKGLKRKLLSNETFFVNEIHGTGEIYLEPSFGHFFCEKFVVLVKVLFATKACSLQVSDNSKPVQRCRVQCPRRCSGAKGCSTPHITGSGIAVLYSPVPKQEIMKYTLKDDKLFVDGNFALLRNEGVKFKVERSSKRLIGSLVYWRGSSQDLQRYR